MRLFLTWFLLSLASVAQIPQGGITAPAEGGTFTFNQAASTQTQAGNGIAVTLGSNPTTGDLVTCSFTSFTNTILLSSIQDGSSNAYTLTPSSPFRNVFGGGASIWVVYLVAPSNANAVITATFTTTPGAGSLAMFCVDSHKSGGTPTIDTDATGTASTGTAINTPAIVTAFPHEFCYSVVIPGGAWSSTNTPWTSAGVARHGNNDGYIEDASGSTPLNFTGTTSAGWDSMEACWHL